MRSHPTSVQRMTRPAPLRGDAKHDGELQLGSEMRWNPRNLPSRTERYMQARAQKTLFKVGDKAVYPAQGVAEVISIEEKDIAGQRQQFYVLRILDTNRKIMVPVDNARHVGLRPPISEKEIQEIFAILRERTIAFDNQTWNRRYRGFMDKIKTGSVYDVAEVMRDLYRLKAEKSLSFGERRMLETARALIVKEIAVTRAKSEDKVQAEIEKIFEPN
jgi:CarD family transcriptional regulator